MKVFKMLIFILILTNTLFGQNEWKGNICGNYVLFNDNEKDFTVFIEKNFFSLHKHVPDEEVINSDSNIDVIPDYEGITEIILDTLLLIQNHKDYLAILFFWWRFRFFY
ncbi:MAG: hypothetical protein K8R53_02045 [Bacteroidales bacterium]|nr:hypothetical protein [Bacteroidales bacterium]